MSEHATFPTIASKRTTFGGVAAAYDRGRPTYPPNAVVWLVGTVPGRVLELGAGTGKLTKSLVALGHDVFATDPDPDMLARLHDNVPEATTTCAGAELIPLPDVCIDVIVAAQAFHWFDFEKALPEIARVLGAGGQLSLVWNIRDDRIPWVKRLGKIIGNQEHLHDPTEVLANSGLFGPVEKKSFPHWQVVNRETIVDLVMSRSNILSLTEDAREAKVQEVIELYDSYGRGMDGMRLPYLTECYRCDVLDQPEPEPEASIATPAGEASWLDDIGGTKPTSSDVLIDLH